MRTSECWRQEAAERQVGESLRTDTSFDVNPPPLGTARYQPAWWLPGGDCQTLWPVLARPRPRLCVRRQCFVLPDDDCLSLVWGPHQDGPLVLILHGLGGCASAPYALGMLRALSHNGLQGVIMEYRGVGTPPSRGDRLYHAGAWQDLHDVVRGLHRFDPERAIGIIGFSLGGSILLNWLIADSKAPVAAAVAVSVPFDLASCAHILSRRFARIYQWNLLRCLKRLVLRHYAAQDPAPISLPPLHTIQTLRAFDEQITAPLHGYADADDYYHRCSCAPHLHHISHPTLLVHARDDPVAPPPTFALAQNLSPAVQLEITPSGGHVGFVQGRWPWNAEYWLEQRVVTYLLTALHANG